MNQTILRRLVVVCLLSLGLNDCRVGCSRASAGDVAAAPRSKPTVRIAAAQPRNRTIDFRLKHLSDPRAKAVLAAAAQKANWDKRPSPKPNATATEVVTGRGVGLGVRNGTYVATIAEVEVNRKTGAARVKRFVCAHDCGLIVNPDGLRGVIDANLMHSMSRAMKEEVTFD